MKRCFVFKYSITHFITQTGLIVVIFISHKGMFPRSQKNPALYTISDALSYDT